MWALLSTPTCRQRYLYRAVYTEVSAQSCLHRGVSMELSVRRYGAIHDIVCNSHVSHNIVYGGPLLRMALHTAMVPGVVHLHVNDQRVFH